jgi:hypothetical protein
VTTLFASMSHSPDWPFHALQEDQYGEKANRKQDEILLRSRRVKAV